MRRVSVIGDVQPERGGSPEWKVRIGAVGRNTVAAQALMPRTGQLPLPGELASVCGLVAPKARANRIARIPVARLSPLRNSRWNK